jgi:hypothetical protein
LLGVCGGAHPHPQTPAFPPFSDAEGNCEAGLSSYVWGFVLYFNHTRPHQGINQHIPAASSTDATMTAGAIISQSVLGGLHHDYRRVVC